LVTHCHNHSDYLRFRSRFVASVTGGDRRGLTARRKWHQKWHQLLRTGSLPGLRSSISGQGSRCRFPPPSMLGDSPSPRVRFCLDGIRTRVSVPSPLPASKSAGWDTAPVGTRRDTEMRAGFPGWGLGCGQKPPRPSRPEPISGSSACPAGRLTRQPRPTHAWSRSAGRTEGRLLPTRWLAPSRGLSRISDLIATRLVRQATSEESKTGPPEPPSVPASAGPFRLTHYAGSAVAVADHVDV
jgi:hypothetical protein